MDKFIIISRDYHVLPLADRLRDDGKHVVFGMVEKEDDPDAPKAKIESRMTLYDGILDKHPATKVLDWMRGLNDKSEWFVLFDYGDLWPLSERALKMGFTKGIFPTEESYKLEKDRQAGKEFARKYYPDLKVAEVHEFKKVDDAIKFLQDDKEHIYVLKSEGSNAETVVPQTTDVDLGRRQIIGALLTERAGYEKGGLTLEEKIAKPIELTPIMVFWEGKPLFSLIELENKPLGSGNIGRLTGGCQNLTMETRLNAPINKIAFPQIIYEMAKKQPGLSIYDAGLLFDGEEFYFTEFCSQRWGYDGFYSELEMCGNHQHKLAAVRHFDLITQGQNPLTYKFGAAVRLFQTQPDPKFGDMFESGYEVDWLNEVSEQLYLYNIRREKDVDGEKRFLSVGYEKDLGVATGAANNMQDAIENAYRAAYGVAMTGLYFRPKFDFLSKDYFTSIANRYDFLLESDWL